VEYVRKISNLTTFLYETDPTSDSIARFLALDTFAPFDPSALLLGLLQIDGSIKVVSSFGISEAIKAEVLAIAERPANPFSQSMQKDKVLGFGGLEELFSNSLDEKKVESHLSDLKYSLAWPIHYLGAGIIFFQEESTLDSLDELFFRAIGGMLALHHTYTTTLSDFTEGIAPSHLSGASTNYSPRPLISERKELTSRQRIILAELLRGETNATIAQGLNFSSSLIRQETMEIYRKLGVSGRKELLERDS
jgi:DNA-binding CsgD family transcriptional regulator